MTREIDRRQDPSPREDMALKGIFQILDVMIEQVVMATTMCTLHCVVSKIPNRQPAHVANDQQTEQAIGLHLTDPEMLLHFSLHNFLDHQLIQITED
jgi:hypothetical protein